MKRLILLFSVLLSFVCSAQTPLNDTNFYQAIAVCLSTNPIDGLCYDCEYGAMPDWDVSAITKMDSAFYFSMTFNADLSAWDVSQVKSMRHMFDKSISFNQDISAWDVSQVTDMTAMFAFAYEFNQPIGDWEVGQVTSMSLMFGGAHKFNQEIGS